MAPFPLTTPHNGKDSTTELKAVERSVFRKRRALWGGFIAVVVPLFVLLALQS